MCRCVAAYPESLSTSFPASETLQIGINMAAIAAAISRASIAMATILLSKVIYRAMLSFSQLVNKSAFIPD